MNYYLNTQMWIKMTKAIVILAPGFEEIEATTIIDILRRGEIDVEVVGLAKNEVQGAHDIKIIPDSHIDEKRQEDYDAVILPGGSPGYLNLKTVKRFSKLLKKHMKTRN